LEDLTHLPPDTADRSFFSDWGDPREYTLGDMGVGECAGEVVSAFDFDMAAAERGVFDAQVDLDRGDFQRAARTAYLAMVQAAKALVKLDLQDVGDDPDVIVREFTTRFYDTQKFFDAFAGGKFAQYLFAAHASANRPATPDSARYLIDEAQLFIDAAHACYNRLGTVAVPVEKMIAPASKSVHA
jgi:sulfite reductase (ferredoxin)